MDNVLTAFDRLLTATLPAGLPDGLPARLTLDSHGRFALPRADGHLDELDGQGRTATDLDRLRRVTLDSRGRQGQGEHG